MKKFLTMLSLVLLGFASTSCYDDSALWESVDELDARVETLETLCTEMNSNLNALTTLVKAMSVGDYVISVSPLKDDAGNEIGYRIVFKENGPVDLYHGIDGTNGTNGTNGTDGHSPVIGTQKGEDGLYYWTLDGELIKDEAGNKLPLTAAAPQVKVADEKWYVSYDNGQTWTELGPAVTVGIKDVDYTDDVLILTMNDGTKIEVNIGSAFKVVLGEFDAKTLNYGSDLVIPYTIEGAEGDVVVFMLKDGEGFAVELVEETATTGKVTVSQTSVATKEVAGKVGIFAVGEDGTTVSQAVRFVSGVFTTVEGNQEKYTVANEGGKVEFKIATNAAFEVKTNADWVTYVQTKAVEEKTLTFEVAANVGEDREAKVEVTSGSIKFEFTILQTKDAVAVPEESLVGNYLITFMWVYGGTGPEYGGGGWVDMHNKTWWFDETTGHGIHAELDNYLEFTLAGWNDDYTQSNGKCVNWAGKDGKNWDTWFYNNYNASKGEYRNPDAPKDGSNFYRQIPIGESTWVRDYTVTPNTVTFTDAEGKKTVVEVYDAPYTFVPGYNDKNASNNTRTFPRTGVKSPISGVNENCDLSFHAVLKGTDNWNKSNTEIDKLFYRPRDLVIDVKKVDEIPAEAKTTEAKYTPTFPEEEKPATLAGTYKFRDGKTVGGKDDAITAKGFIEQYGGWDPVKASINSMKDDKFTFTATGTDADGNETGTVTFDKGADGATWDYKLLDNMSNNKEYDGTAMYCIISVEGTTTYVYNATEGKVTLTADGREYVVDFLAPGTYKYSGIDVTVPTASAFGFHLDLGYTEERVADYAKKSTSNGFARHYVWARHHVFMFDKQ